jgi:hypothetical protein
MTVFPLPHRRVAASSTAVLALTLLAAAAPAMALDEWQYQLHGFAAQAYAHSDGNNYVGSSLDGSFEFYELGLNAAAARGPFALSAQGLLRRFGNLDDGDLRLDYAFADYRAISTLDYKLGVRLGRVKNHYGFFNDSRDVVFTRPGILLPSSVYFEGTGIRGILFSSDGAQIYGGIGLGDHYLSLAATRAIDYTAGKDEKRALVGDTSAFPNDLDIDGLTIVRLMDEWAGGTWRAALTYTSARVSLAASMQSPLAGSLDADIWVASLRHNAERFAVTAEYQVTHTQIDTNFTGRDRSSSDGGYLQFDYLIQPRWTAMLRYDLIFSDRDDRDGRDYAAQTGDDRSSRYARDLTAGLKWLPDEHWGVWLEHHVIRGSASAPSIENQGRSLRAEGNLFVMMLGYHF